MRPSLLSAPLYLGPALSPRPCRTLSRWSSTHLHDPCPHSQHFLLLTQLLRQVSIQCPVLEGTACTNCICASPTRALGPGRKAYDGAGGKEGGRCALLIGRTRMRHVAPGATKAWPAGRSTPLRQLSYPFTDPSWSEKGDLKEKTQWETNFWLCPNLEPIPRTTRIISKSDVYFLLDITITRY